MSATNIDVLVVGAGPVGLFCAHELTRHGLSCRIIDKKSTISDKSKALGIHVRTLTMLEDCGLLPEFLNQGHLVDELIFKTKKETVIHAFLPELSHEERLYLLDLPQSQTEAILYQRIQKMGVEVEWNTELTQLTQSSHEVTSTIHKPNNKIELLNSTWLIACDGAHSTVRQQVGARFSGAAYERSWWLADVFVDWPLSGNAMRVYIDKKGILACFAMDNKRYRLVNTAPQKLAGDPSLEQIQQVFNERCCDSAPLRDPVWINQFSIHHRQIDHYRDNRVFFAGDAAHIHSPIGGQGLNTGMQDIYNLVWKLALVEKRLAKPMLIDSYHNERYPVGQEVLRKTNLFTRLLLLQNPLLIALRNRMMKLMGSFKAIQYKIISNLAGLAISYKKSTILCQKGCVKNLKAGTFVPLFKLTDAKTQTINDSRTLIQDTAHHLLSLLV